MQASGENQLRWSVHVPRSLQERRLVLAKAADALSQTLDRSPTTAELAAYLDLSPEDDAAAGSFVERLGEDDPGMESVENLQALRPLLEHLGQRDRRILQMRFGAEMTQSEIAAELSISQMHVSRLLGRILKTLRAGMLTQA
ncbi:MAG: polymerase sigma-B factor [Streptomycetaceae bacterium]|nr:polymerase sigma-B factor [Streptomycetaceae bacterium]